MKKTFCDRHTDQECVNRVGHLHLSVVQQTNKGEVVSEDEYRTMDLCGGCVDDILATYLPSKLLMVKEDVAIARDVTVEETDRDTTL